MCAPTQPGHLDRFVTPLCLAKRSILIALSRGVQRSRIRRDLLFPIGHGCSAQHREVSSSVISRRVPVSMTSRDDQIRALQEQVNTWRTKYESLAKLYSQLRHEHLELLNKFKTVQLKAASAQEAIERREKLERGPRAAHCGPWDDRNQRRHQHRHQQPGPGG